MAFNFPDPAVSTTATNPVTGAKYQWKADPGKWVLTGGPADAPNPPVTISLLPPEGPQKGDLWIHEETLVEYAWDGTQWFEVGSSCGGGDGEEEEENEMYPFVNSFRLVAPDDFNDEPGTAFIRTPAYSAGADWYLSPFIEDITFAFFDLNGRRHEQAVEGDTIHIAPKTKAENDSGYLYASFEVTNVMSNGIKTLYEGDYDSSRSVSWTEGDTIYYRIAPVEEEPYQPFIGKYKLVAPDDYTGEDGTATIKTDAYEGGDDTFLSPVVKEFHFARFDLDGRSHRATRQYQSFDVAPSQAGTGNFSDYTHTSFLVKDSITEISNYIVERDNNTMFTFSEGEIIYYRPGSSHYVNKTGGDTVEGPLLISGKRTAGDDPDKPYHESTIRVLNVDNTQNSSLRLRHNGSTKVYVGGDAISIASDIKFNRAVSAIISSNVQEVLKVNDRDIAYLGQILEDDSLVTKEYVDTTDEALRQDIIELEEEIDAIAPSVERGEWSYTNTGVASVRGSYSMNTDTFDAGLGDPANIFAAVENFVLNERDLEGTIHSFANVEPGQLLEVFESGDSDYGLYEIIKAEAKSGGGVNSTPAFNYWSIDVKLVRTGVDDKADARARFKIFSPPSGGTADGFVLKSGDTMEGPGALTIKTTKDIDFTKPASNTAYLSFKNDYNGNVRTSNLFIAGGTSSALCTSTSLFVNGGIVSLTGYYYAYDGVNTYKPRVRLESTRGSLMWDGSFVLSWTDTEIGAFKAIRLNNPDKNTDSLHAIHKGYVDEQIAALLARIEELENTSSSSGSSMTNNFKFDIQHTNRSVSSDSISGVSAGTSTLEIALNGITVAPRGRIHIVEKSKNNLSASYLFNIVTSTPGYLSDSSTMNVWTLHVVPDTHVKPIGDHSIYDRVEVIVSLLDGAISDEPGLGNVSFSVKTADMEYKGNSGEVTDPNKAYTLSSAGVLSSNYNFYGLFMPYEFLNSDKVVFAEKGFHVVGTVDKSFGYWRSSSSSVPKERVEERTINGIKGIALWDYSAHSSNVSVGLKRVLLSLIQ